jgi:hypothetical protein
MLLTTLTYPAVEQCKVARTLAYVLVGELDAAHGGESVAGAVREEIEESVVSWLGRGSIIDGAIVVRDSGLDVGDLVAHVAVFKGWGNLEWTPERSVILNDLNRARRLRLGLSRHQITCQ